MTRRELEADLALLRETIGLLRAALEQKHCPPDCSCRPQLSFSPTTTTTGTMYPYTIPSGNIWYTGGGSYHTDGNS